MRHMPPKLRVLVAKVEGCENCLKTFTLMSTLSTECLCVPVYVFVCLLSDDERGAMSLLGGAHLRAFAEHDARAMEAATRAMEEVSKRMEEASRAAALATAHSGAVAGSTPGPGGAGITVGGHHPGAATSKYVHDMAGPPCKRPAMFDDEQRFLSHLGVPSARLKMTTQSQSISLHSHHRSSVSVALYKPTLRSHPVACFQRAACSAFQTCTLNSH